MKTKQELIKKIAASWINAESIVEMIDAEGWLRNPGEPIDPEDIREGDRVRRVHGNGDEVAGTVEYLGGWVVGCKYFLLDRPKPELPTEPGARFIAHSPKWCDDAEDQREFIVAGSSVVDLSNGALFNRVAFAEDWTVTEVMA